MQIVREAVRLPTGGRIVFTPTPDGAGYTFEAPTRLGRLFAGVAVPAPSWMPVGEPTGAEHLRPADTFDADYGRLLDRVLNRPVVASPTGFEPVF